MMDRLSPEQRKHLAAGQVFAFCPDHGAISRWTDGKGWKSIASPGKSFALYVRPAEAGGNGNRFVMPFVSLSHARRLTVVIVVMNRPRDRLYKQSITVTIRVNGKDREWRVVVRTLKAAHPERRLVMLHRPTIRILL